MASFPRSGTPLPTLLTTVVLAGALGVVVSSSVSAAAPRDEPTTVRPRVAASPAAAAEPAPWVWPTGTRVVERGWEPPSSDYTAGHRGIDVPAAIGTTAVAVDDGTVAFAGSVGGRTVVTVDHGDGLVSTLDSVQPLVTAGTKVRRGDAVGRVSVGHCPAAAPCLHLGARIDGRYVDPTPYLPPPAWPVLLPESAWRG